LGKGRPICGSQFALYQRYYYQVALGSDRADIKPITVIKQAARMALQMRALRALTDKPDMVKRAIVNMVRRLTDRLATVKLNTLKPDTINLFMDKPPRGLRQVDMRKRVTASREPMLKAVMDKPAMINPLTVRQVTVKQVTAKGMLTHKEAPTDKM